MLWLLETLAKLIAQVIFAVIALMINAFLELFDFDIQRFYNIFDYLATDLGLPAGTNILDTIYEIIKGMAITICVLNMIFRLYRSIFSKRAEGSVDEPVPLIFKSCICLTVICLIGDVLDFIMEHVNTVFTIIRDNIKLTSLASLTTDGLKGMFDNASGNGNAFLGADAETTLGLFGFSSGFALVSCIIAIIFTVILGWRFFKMLITYVSRYVQFCILYIFTPLGISGGGSKATADTMKSYIKLFVSTIFSMMFSAMFLYLYAYVMVIVFKTDYARYSIFEKIIEFAIANAIFKIYNSLETYLDKIGLTNVQSIARTGPGPLASFMMGPARAAGAVAHTADKILAAMGKQTIGEKVGEGLGKILTPEDGKAKPATGTEPGLGLQGEAAREIGDKASALVNGTDMLGGKEDAITGNLTSFDPEQTKDLTNQLGGYFDKQEATMANGNAVTDENAKMGMFTGGDGDVGGMAKLTKDAANDTWKDKNGNDLPAGQISDAISKGGSIMTARLGQEGVSMDDKNAMSKALEKHGGKNGKAFGMINTDNGAYSASFKKMSDGTWQTKANGKTFSSPQEAAKALGGKTVDMFKGKPQQLTKDNIMDAAAKPSMVAQSSVNPKDAKQMSSALAGNVGTDGKVHGRINTANGAYDAEFTKTPDGQWKTKANGSEYSSPKAACEALAGHNIDVYSAQTPNASSGVNSALNSRAGITGGKNSSPMPENKGYQILASGRGEIHGIYADMNNVVRPFSAKSVDVKYAKANPSKCITIPTNNGIQNMKVMDGSRMQSVKNYANHTKFEKGKFVSEYSTHRNLDEEGNA